LTPKADNQDGLRLNFKQFLKQKICFVLLTVCSQLLVGKSGYMWENMYLYIRIIDE